MQHSDMHGVVFKLDLGIPRPTSYLGLPILLVMNGLIGTNSRDLDLHVHVAM